MLIKIDNAIITVWNKIKGLLICTLIGHDVVMTQCFRCWKWDKTWSDN